MSKLYFSMKVDSTELLDAVKQLETAMSRVKALMSDLGSHISISGIAPETKIEREITAEEMTEKVRRDLGLFAVSSFDSPCTHLFSLYEKNDTVDVTGHVAIDPSRRD